MNRFQCIFEPILNLCTALSSGAACFRRNTLFPATVLTLVLSIPCHASVILRGTVTDRQTGKPLPGANVQILGTVLGAGTDMKGVFEVRSVPPGVYSVRASMIGYRPVVQDHVAVGQAEVTLNFELKETPIELDPIVVLAGKVEQQLEQAPVSLSVITSRDITRRNPTNLVQALESMSGVHFIGEQINIRGSTGYTFGVGNKVLLLLDGVPVYASDTGAFNWDMLPPLDIEQIEVLKGAGSTLWGASALGGVVNVITKPPSPRTTLLFSVTAGKYGRPSYDEWIWTDPGRLHYTREDISFSKQLGNLGVRISAGRYFSTGYQELGDVKKYNLTGKFDARLRGSARWTGYAAYSRVDRGFFIQWKGQNDPYEVDESNLDNYAKTHQLNLYSRLSIPFSARFAVQLRLSMVRTLMGNQFGEDAGFNPAYGQGLELQAHYIPVTDHTVTFGLQVQSDAGSTKYFGDHRGYFLGPYVQDEWKARENLRITAGIRYDRYQLMGDMKEDLFSPRLGINWQLWQGTTLRASLGSGFRAATIVERFLELSIMNFDIIPNPDLEAESAWAFDLGWRQRISENWNMDISLFDNEYSELIEAHLDLIRGQIQFRNIPRARIRGIEMTTNWSMAFQFLKRQWIPGLQISLTAMDHEDMTWHEPLTYRPKILATVKSLLQTGPLYLQADFRYASKIDQVKIYPINDRVAMKFVDVRIAWSVWKIAFQAGVNNLLNYNYASMESNLMPPRTYFVGIRGEN